MTRMLPSFAATDAPPGEHELFEALRDSPGTDDWVAFHSLNIAKHTSQVEGEADFVVLIPDHGVLVIEVKSHERVEANGDGLWKFGNHDWTSRSPFDQASGAMHSILDYLQGHGVEPIGYPVASAVWLTAIAKGKVPDAIGWQPWALLDAADLHANDFAGRVIRVLTKSSEHLEEMANGYRRVAGKPTAEDVERVVAILEPRFVATLTVAEATRRREKELHEFTAEQLILLDVVASNPRVLVDGPAGCGKTFMAVEATQRAVAQGKRVLVVVYNRLIEAELKALCVGADVYRIHELMAERAGVELPTNADHDWYTQTLPDLALDAALGSEPAYDYLVVDEAQDIAEPHYLEFLDLILVDGLVRSPLFVTGDFDHQSIYSGDSSTKAVMIGRLPNVTYLSLKSNVRSTPEVGRFVAQLVGDETLYAQHRRTDDDIVSVEIHEYSTPAEQDTLLAAAVELILSEPFKVRDIVILSPIRESAAAKATDQKLRDRLGANIEAPHGIRWGTIHGFKGMEAPAVILTDIDEANANLADLLYVGASRATDRLIVLRVSRQ